MNNRASIEIPVEMHRLVTRYGDLHGLDANDYATMALARHFEDIHDIAVADEAMKQIRSGEDKVLTSEEFWRGLDD